jgi:prepilin-type N-terminal cleavage/methylation domain-containing protein
MIGSHHRGPAGFSLLEILVAASMLAIAVTALSQLASLGRKHLAAATEQAIATRLATNQMARIAAGIDPPTPQEAQPLAEDPAWECQIEAMAVVLPNSVALPNLTEVRVHVRPAAANGQVENGQATTGQEKPWYTLARWITLRGDAPTTGPTAATSAATSAAATVGSAGRRLDRRFDRQPANARAQPEAVFRPAVP